MSFVSQTKNFLDKNTEKDQSKEQNVTFKYIYLLWRQNNLYSYKNYKTYNRTKKRALKKYHIQNGTSYLAWSSKHEIEMITKIQHQTALWRSAVSSFQPKIIKPKYTEHGERLIKSLCVCVRVFTWRRAVRQQPTVNPSSAGLCFFFSTRMLESCSTHVSAQRRGSGARQGWKICLTGEKCKFKKTRMECLCWRSPGRQMFSAVSQKKKWYFLSFLH